MKAVFTLALVISEVLCSRQSFASKLVNQDMRQYFPSFGIGSTQSVAIGAATASTAQILSPSGSATELVQVVVSQAAFVAQGTPSAPADATSMFIPANTPTILEVLSGNVIGAKAANAAGSLFVTHLITFPKSN